jgi:hypothetical protein
MSLTTMVVKLNASMPKRLPESPNLSAEQRVEYERLKEEIVYEIHEGLKHFQIAAQKLLRIRDGRLYREEFNTFEEFCRQTLGHSKTYANNLIAGYNLVCDFAAMGIAVLPDSERLARELSKYPKSMRHLIWKRALQLSGRRNPNYALIKQAATELLPAKIVREHWLREFMDTLRMIDHKLTMSLNLDGVSQQGIEDIAALFISIEQKLGNLSIEVGRRINEIKRSERNR